jgi:N-acyl-D-amino-acid deacylase
MKSRHVIVLSLFILSLSITVVAEQRGDSLLLKDATIYDGSGRPPFRGDVRVSGNRITTVGKALRPRRGELVRAVEGLALAPGFIDMHSHADSELLDVPEADVAVRQGITTVLVGQDGGSEFPLAEFLAKLEKLRPGINVATMVGHATIRQQVMGKDLFRPATATEVARMGQLAEQEMAAGAFGLSTGLEYEQAHFSTTEEVVGLARVAARHGGFYISHVRDEANRVFESFRELIEIGARAGLPAEITHIKLAAPVVLKQAAVQMPGIFAEAERQGVDLVADVYPYTYWHSTLKVIVLDRDYFNRERVEKAIADNGGAERLRIAKFALRPELESKTLAQIASEWKVDPAEVFMRVVKMGEEAKDPDDGDATVLGESMVEEDIRWFVAHPRIMFCTDGQLRGRHPRGAGAMPRILGRYVREQKVLPLEEAIRKMTSLPALRLGLRDRGRILPGYIADIVIFDPQTVSDRATVEAPLAPPIGIEAVMVGGRFAVEKGELSAERNGQVLRRQARSSKP